jgi:hypothetical protein
MDDSPQNELPLGLGAFTPWCPTPSIKLMTIDSSSLIPTIVSQIKWTRAEGFSEICHNLQLMVHQPGDMYSPWPGTQS